MDLDAHCGSRLATPGYRENITGRYARKTLRIYGREQPRFLPEDGFYEIIQVRKTDNIMQKIITKWWSVGVGGLLLWMFLYGLTKMYFHQDDLDWFIIANKPFGDFWRYPIGDHVNYVWRALLKTEWELIGLYFPPYLFVSVIMHTSAVWLIYVLGKATSGRSDLASYAALLFTINTNWTESVLWISGQTISITAVFVLLGMLAVWKKKNQGIMMLLASWTSALSLGFIAAGAIVYRDLRVKALAIVGILGIIYTRYGGDGTAIEWSLEWVGQVMSVAGLMMINSVVGRLIIPFDRMESMRIILVVLLMVYGLWRGRDNLRAIWRDQWSRFLIFQIIFYNVIVAVGRAQYGVGIMRAERYAYLGLALSLLLMVRVARNWVVGRWVWLVPIIVMIQVGGFYQRAQTYIERPQKLQELVRGIRRGEVSDPQAYLPHFVFNDERLRYRDLIDLVKD